jgi:hypothetical protein
MREGDLDGGGVVAVGHGGVALIVFAASAAAQGAERDERDLLGGRARNHGGIGIGEFQA